MSNPTDSKTMRSLVEAANSINEAAKPRPKEITSIFSKRFDQYLRGYEREISVGGFYVRVDVRRPNGHRLALTASNRQGQAWEIMLDTESGGSFELARVKEYAAFLVQFTKTAEALLKDLQGTSINDYLGMQRISS